MAEDRDGDELSGVQCRDTTFGFFSRGGLNFMALLSGSFFALRSA